MDTSTQTLSTCRRAPVVAKHPHGCTKCCHPACLQTDAMIWVVDSADTQRLQDCRQELHGLLKEERLAGASLLIFANKQDIQGARTAEQIEQALDLEAMGTRHWRVIACSAVSGAGLLEGFEWVTADVRSRIFVLD